jgi:hypothetical protein
LLPLYLHKPFPAVVARTERITAHVSEPPQACCALRGLSTISGLFTKLPRRFIPGHPASGVQSSRKLVDRF